MGSLPLVEQTYVRLKYYILSNMFRKRHQELAYKRIPKHTGCPFCDVGNKQLNPQPRTTIKETEHMQVIKNMFPYSIWEHLNVEEHLLLVPKRHLSNMADLTSAERTDFMSIVCEFESEGYSNYTRSQHSVSRSLPHIHTHLIKTGTKIPRVSIAIKKPYFIITF